MERMKSIEALSAVFTAGIVAGTLLFTTPSFALPSLLLPLLTLPCLFKGKLLSLPEKTAVGIVLGSFLLLGLFCAATSALSYADEPFWMETAAHGAAEKLRALIDGLPWESGGTAPLLKALLTGDRSGLPAHTVAVFRSSGASHLLALSGLHIGIIYLLFDKLTWLMGRTKTALYLRFGLIVSGAGFYTLMTGASPSIVRAFLFILIGETLRLAGRPRKPSRVLCLALFIQLVLDPAAIRSLGFQLSYLAMAGIFILYPRMQKWYPEGPQWNPLRRIWQAAALSISCQVFTGPLVWLRFHTFPRHFLLTNLLAIPLTTALVATALVTLLLAGAGWSVPLLLKATDTLANLLQGVLEIISSM